MKLRRSSVLGFVTLASVGLGLYACSGDDTVAPPGTDAGTDAVADVAKDAPKDAPLDAPKDGSVDTGVDAGLNPTSAQIAAVRAAAVPVVVPDAGADAGDAAPSDAAIDAAVDAGTDGGGIPVNLPITDAIVTYVRTLAVGSDPAGFFLQAEQKGPAIFVAIDPATLTPVPVAGDKVSMVVTAVANVSSAREIVALTGWTRSAQGTPLAPLLQDVTAANDLVTALDSYESEYLKVSGTVATDFASLGTGFVGAQITTTGIVAGNNNFRMRFPATVQTSIDIAKGCTFALTGIMWRFTTNAEPSGWADGDVSALVCNAPKVTSAASTVVTTVIVNFDRKIDTNSLLSNGTQFTVNNGLTVSAAVLSGPNQVTLTTSAQTPGAAYTVTVANTLKDTLAKGIDVTANTANFLGFLTPAVLRLNELNPNITNGLDLIELRVVTAGSILGITIEENLVNTKVTLATLPALQVAVDDLIVVHLTPPVNPDAGVGVINETTTKGDCTDATCYPGAWDVRGAANGMTYSGRVIVVRTANAGALQDGISWFRTGSAPAAQWFAETNALGAATQWVDCGGVACVDNTGATGISVDSNGSGATAAGASVRRLSNTDTNAKADWGVGASTFGVANP